MERRDGNKKNKNDLVKDTTRWIKARGLTVPAIMFLEVSKPFSFIGSQALLLAEPTLGVFAPEGFIPGVAKLLEDRKGLERLICELEAEG
jgi:hypothetical protein